jgi:SAM-dependent methyltransferase
VDKAEIEKLAALETTHWWYGARRAMLRRAVRGLPPGRALDVGAGAGGNTAVLLEEGWSAAAVELSPTGAAIARNRGIRITRADATALPFDDGAFDLLVSMDLWEHIDADHRAASEAFRVLKPGGLLFLAVPSGMDLWSGHDVAVGHVRRYERSDLVRLVEDAGFTIRTVKPWNVLLRPVVRWRRGGTSTQEGEGSSDLTAVPKPLNAMLRSVVELERFLPLSRRRGVTLVVTAVRP